MEEKSLFEIKTHFFVADLWTKVQSHFRHDEHVRRVLAVRPLDVRQHTRRRARTAAAAAAESRQRRSARPSAVSLSLLVEPVRLRRSE